MRRSASGFLFLGILSVVLSGCAVGPPAEQTLTAPPNLENACTPYSAPAITDQGETFRGTNAFAYTIGLICDHTAPFPQTRARVPGTAGQAEGAAYLVRALEQAGFEARLQNFSGEAYETLMQRKQNSAAYPYFASSFYCDAPGRVRLRSLDFSNVVGTGGTVGAPNLFLFMAHWDSKRFAEGTHEPVLGANDGAAGVGVLLELARTLAIRGTSWEIRILLTDGEDGFEDCHPLAGSMYYADRMSTNERDRLRAGRLVLLDMIGDADSSFYKGCGTDTDLADRLWEAAARLDVHQFKQGGGCGAVDDHLPFEEEGIKTVDIIPPFGPGTAVDYWHTTEDTPDKLDVGLMGDVGRILLEVLDELEPALPILP